ncbi:MAG: site-2 protease family protein [Candidatus Spechtbacterales bacterium]|nr:site-2 protease family protein [Candidatus Spechtbacterales bacterium]
MEIVTFIIFIAILIFSVVLHEVAHGVTANYLGDPTAKMMGRLTLNPIPHLDMFGSIILPLLLAIPMLFGAPSVIFGWAKPVPYNPYNLRNKKWGPAMVGGAGPATNLFLALVFGLALRFIMPVSADSSLFGLAVVFMAITYINLLLAVFNLVPIPPLDGSKLLFSLFNVPHHIRTMLERNGFIFLLLFIFLGFQMILPIIQGAFSLITGVGPGAFI